MTETQEKQLIELIKALPAGTGKKMYKLNLTTLKELWKEVKNEEYIADS